MIRVIGVGKRFGRGPFVIDGVDAEVRAGEPLVVLGANGAGKSTLLRIVAGCLAPTRGRVVGRPATVGYVPDRFPAHLRMPAAAYLRHLAHIREACGANIRHSRGATADGAIDLLARLGFRGGAGTPMNRLSKGNAQKVGLAQALCSGAPLLVLDEPWSGLDTDTRPVLTEAIEHATAAVVVTDHTRTAETLTGHRTLLLGEPTAPRAVAITLRCAEPELVGPRLAGFGAVERRVGGLALRVPADRVDDLLATALRLGCSVHEVRP